MSSRTTFRDGPTPCPDGSSQLAPCFVAKLVLSLPNVIIQPSLDEIQNMVNSAVQCVSEIGSRIPLWVPAYLPHNLSLPKSRSSISPGECLRLVMLCAASRVSFPLTPSLDIYIAHFNQLPPQQSNCSIAIHDSKDILKLISVLSSSILTLRQDLVKVC